MTRLFDLSDLKHAPPPEPLTRYRLHINQIAEALAARQHPLTVVLGSALPLHSEAAPALDREAPGRRCGNCAHWWSRRPTSCLLYRALRPAEDLIAVPAWWPGCVHHNPPAGAR